MQLLCCLEGIRAGLDVYARYCVLLDDNSLLLWWNTDQLKQLCNSWEACLYDMAASNFKQADSDKKSYFNQVYSHIYSVNGRLFEIMGLS